MYASALQGLPDGLLPESTIPKAMFSICCRTITIVSFIGICSSSLDTSAVDAHFSHRGQHAYAPQQIVSILIYAYSHGVFSSLQIEKRCNEDLGFMYVAGKRCPNFRVLSDFRKDHGDFFRSCFKQTVQMALELDMVSLGPCEFGRIQVQGEQFEAQGDELRSDEGA